MTLPPVPPAPRRPKRRPPQPKKKKSDTEKLKSITTSGGGSSKVVILTEAEKIQVDIIDWKRCSIRALLILAYSILIHFIVSICIVGYGYRVVQQSHWLMVSLYGFLLNLMVYFFGTGEAILAISYVWSFGQFVMGIVLIILGIFMNIGFYLIGMTTSSEKKVKNGMPYELLQDCANDTLRTANKTVDMHAPSAYLIKKEKVRRICELVDSQLIQKTVAFLPFVLPPMALVCTVVACVCAYLALKVVPNRFKKGVIDARFVEPYVTYDFYVGHGRNVPKVTGNDYGVEEHSHVVTYFPGEEDESASAARPRGDEGKRMSNIGASPRLSRGSATPKNLLAKSKLGVPSGAKRNQKTLKANNDKLGGPSGKVIPGIKKRN